MDPKIPREIEGIKIENDQGQNTSIGSCIVLPNFPNQANTPQKSLSTNVHVPSTFSPVPVAQNVLEECVVFVGNLDPEKVKINHLYNLFGFYGNISKIKMLLKTPGNALIEYQSSEERDNAMKLLSNAAFFGTILKVSKSKFLSLLGLDGMFSDSERDYTSLRTTFDRYPEGTASSRYKHVIAPTSKIFVFVTKDVSITDEDSVRSLFETYGKVVKVSLGPKTNMCQVAFESVEQATNALASLHNESFDEGTMRISFSRTSI